MPNKSITIKQLSRLECIFHSVIMFFAIFNPPVLTFNTIHLIAVFSIGYLLVSSSLSKCLNINKITTTYLVLIMLMCYQLFVVLVSHYNAIIISNYVFWLIDVIPYALALNVRLKKKNATFDDFMFIVCVACSIESVMALLALTIPSVKQYFISRIMAYGYSSVQSDLAAFRNYGLADSLTFASSIVQALIACMALYWFIKTKKVCFLTFTVLGAFGAVLNTRSSLIIILIGVLSIVVCIKGKKQIARFCGIVIAICIASYLGLIMLKRLNPLTYDWIMKGVKEIFAFATKDEKNYGYFNYISEESHVQFPSGLHFLFGYGVEVMRRNDFGFFSDIGFVNDIWRSGVLGALIIYTLFIIFILQFKKSNMIDSKTSKFIVVFLLISAFSLNIKGFFFTYNDITTFIWILTIFCCYHKDDNNFKRIYKMIVSSF